VIIYYTILAAGVIGFLIHLYMSPLPRTPLRVLELFMVYQLVFSLGLSSFLSFYGLDFLPVYVATFSGWPACPFEELLANVNLGYFVLGIMCIWYREHFWTATIIGSSIWLLADAFTHIREAWVNGNYMPGNVGVPLYTDIIVPLVLLICLPIYHYLRRQEANQKRMS
jgi:hypothetical protein